MDDGQNLNHLPAQHCIGDDEGRSGNDELARTLHPAASSPLRPGQQIFDSAADARRDGRSGSGIIDSYVAPEGNQIPHRAA